MHKERYCRDISHECHTDTDYHGKFLFSGDGTTDDAETAENFFCGPNGEYLTETDNDGENVMYAWR